MQVGDTWAVSGNEVYREPDTNWQVVGKGDFDGDSHGDLLWRNAVTGEVFVQFFFNGVADGGGVIHREPDAAWRIAQVYDIDNDGKADIVWHHATRGDVFVMMMDGTRIAASGMAYREPDTRWQIAGALRSDASPFTHAHLLWHHTGNGLVYRQGLRHLGEGRFETSGNFFHQWSDLGWRVACTTAFFSLGETDIIWQHSVSGQVYGMQMNNGYPIPLYTGPIHTPPSADWKIVGCGDYDSDRRGELLWRNVADGRLHLMDLGGSGGPLAIRAQATIHAEPDLAWRVLGPDGAPR
jgi:hypothetical protein